MFFQVLHKLLAVCMLREHSKCLLTMVITQLKLASLIVQVSNIVSRFKQECIARATLAEIDLRLIDEAFAQLKDTQIVESLSMLGVVAHGYFKGLVSKTEITNADAHVAYVVPNFCSCLVGICNC